MKASATWISLIFYKPDIKKLIQVDLDKEKRQMKKIVWVFILICAVGLVYHQGDDCRRLTDGSEMTYCGTVVDCAASTIREGSRESRSYIVVSTETEDVLIWEGKGYELDAGLGDTVIVESAIEENTNLRVATNVTVEM